MPTIFTIGYTKKSLELFIHHLVGAEVDVVVDVRLRNTSQLAGFSKRDDLAFLLRHCYGIEYEHHPELAPAAEILDAFKANRDWSGYERAFSASLAETEAQDIGRELLSRFQRPCLLCAEPVPNHCHRRLIADWWRAHLPGIEIIHL